MPSPRKSSTIISASVLSRLRTGGWWVHLRMCQTCGHVGCSDNSPNRHATAHFHETAHPIIRSAEPGEDWSWGYVDEVAFVVDPDPESQG